jgi:hypothetical protein
MCCDARVFRTIGARAPNKSWEVAWLELSGGVRSRPQVPWWNAERRAPSDEGAPHREMRRLRNSAFRRSAFLLHRFPGAAQHEVVRCRTGKRVVYPRMIVTATGPTTGAI